MGWTSLACVGHRGPMLLLLPSPLLVPVLPVLFDVVAVGLVLTWHGCVWQERPTSHRDLLVVVVGAVVGGVHIDRL